MKNSALICSNHLVRCHKQIFEYHNYAMLIKHSDWMFQVMWLLKPIRVCYFSLAKLRHSTIFYDIVKEQIKGGGCGSVGRAVASNSRGLWFESSHHKKLYWTFSVNCIEKTKIKTKRPRMARFFKKIKKNKLNWLVYYNWHWWGHTCQCNRCRQQRIQVWFQ